MGTIQGTDYTEQQLLEAMQAAGYKVHMCNHQLRVRWDKAGEFGNRLYVATWYSLWHNDGPLGSITAKTLPEAMRALALNVTADGTLRPKERTPITHPVNETALYQALDKAGFRVGLGNMPGDICRWLDAEGRAGNAVVGQFDYPARAIPFAGNLGGVWATDIDDLIRVLSVLTPEEAPRLPPAPEAEAAPPAPAPEAEPPLAVGDAVVLRGAKGCASPRIMTVTHVDSRDGYLHLAWHAADGTMVHAMLAPAALVRA